MIIVSVAIQEKFHIRELEPQPGDVPRNEGSRFRQSSVEQKIPLRRHDEKGGDVSGAHIVDVADDPEWLDGSIPLRPLLRVSLRTCDASSKEQENKNALHRMQSRLARERNRVDGRRLLSDDPALAFKTCQPVIHFGEFQDQLAVVLFYYET